MKRGVKKKDYENLSRANIQKVIKLLNPEEGKAITKKEACDILNISYNTTRLDKIIQDFYEREEYVSKRKKANRGKPATNSEIAEAASSYLGGSNITSISKSLFRSPAFVRSLLDRVGVPERPTGENSLEYDIIPEEGTSENFNIGELVWSAKYHAIARIEAELNKEYCEKHKGINYLDYEAKYNSKCYAIYVMKQMHFDSSDTFFPRVESGGFSAYSLAYDLGKLEHLKQYGVDLTRL